MNKDTPTRQPRLIVRTGNASIKKTRRWRR